MEHDQPKVKANKLLKWLDDNGAEIHRQPGSERLPGPFEWIPETSEFQGWLSNGPPTLLLVGRPGSGKTTAASFVVDTLLRQDHLGRRVGVAFLHVGTGKRKRNAMQLVRSLLYQLGQRLASSYIRSRNHPPMDDVLDILSERIPNPSQGDMVSRILPKVIDKFDRVYVVVDELDQMTENRRRLYSSLLGLRNENLRLFLTTCHSPDEKSRLHKDPQILISGANVRKDLDTYVTKRLTDLPKFISYRPIVERRVKKRVMEDANELILAAKLLMDGLMNMRGANIEPKLESTGDLLKELYERFITRLQELNDTKQNFAREILAWLLLMKRPMREVEMRYILERDHDGSILNPAKAINYERFIGLCKDFNILIQDKNSNRFVILSPASQYLLSTLDDWCPGAKTMVARRCLEYLALDEFSKGPCKTDAEYESRLQNYKLYKYAAQHWVDHLQDLQNVPTILIRSFFMDKNKVASASQVMSVSDQRPPQSGYSQRFDPPESGLHLAAQVGSTSVLARLLEEKLSTAQEDTKERTPLRCAIEYDRQEAMKLLSLVDRTTFTRLLERKQISLASALIRAAGSSIRDTASNSALHIGVIKRDMDIVRLSLECGIAVDERGMNGHTAIELAMGLGYSDVIVLLLDHSPDTSRITAQDWLQAFDKRTQSNAPPIIHLEEDARRKKKISFHIAEGFQMKQFPMQYLERRLLIFPDSSRWPGYNGGNWRADFMIYALPTWPAYGISPILDTQWCSILAGVPSEALSGTVNVFNFEFNELAIRWNVEIRPDLDGNDRWVSIDHWSTLRKVSIPDSGMAFMGDLMKELIMGWLEFCDQIDIYLLNCRLRVLHANGKLRRLIGDLLKDATTWINLRRGHRGQVDTLRNFSKGYQNKVYNDQASYLVAGIVQEFSSTIQSRFDKFDEDSSALIQLEFNLTSIRESQKSNSLSISMKRLSWITFVFLPLTFVSGLFGMNVNVLADNPPWWWYLVFMSGTLGLTMLVWLICRKFPKLEDKVDEKFSWLKPNRAGQKRGDVESDPLLQERKDK